MDIAIVTRFYPPDTGGGGIAAYARYIALGLLEQGHQVRVVSLLKKGSKSFQIVEGVHVHRIPMAFKSSRWERLPIVGKQVRFFRDILYAWQIRNTLLRPQQVKPLDIVEYADIDAEGLFHPDICPYVIKLHMSHHVLRSFYTPDQMPYDSGVIEKMESHAIKRSNGISSPSRYLATRMAQLCQLDEKQISWVPNPIDTNFFSPCCEIEPDANLSVLYVGRLEQRKGALVFANAIPTVARAVPNARFVFLGADAISSSGGSQKKELKAYFEKEGVHNRVQFNGHAAPQVFRDFYRDATVCVIPSLFENCPYTLLEAMSCGRPAIVSQSGGMIEMVEDGKTGLLFEAGNSTALAEATIKLLQSPVMRSGVGQAARKKILECYSLPVGAEATASFYRKVIAKSAVN